jgi:enoyl-CoA hydratase/carnithine racemase
MLFLFDMLPMPVLGLVSGRVAGFGLALCSTFDMIWADNEHASFSFQGLAPQSSGLYVSNRFRSSSKVEEMIKSSTILNANQAYESRFITATYDDSQVLDRMLRELCSKVSLTGPNGVAQQKAFIKSMSSVPLHIDSLTPLCAHIANRMLDPEFADSIQGVADPSHQPRYCQKDMEVKYLPK